MLTQYTAIIKIKLYNVLVQINHILAHKFKTIIENINYTTCLHIQLLNLHLDYKKGTAWYYCTKIN